MRIIYFVAFFFIYVNVSAQLTVSDLRCEYLQNPIGIEVEVPRLSWKLKSDKKNVMQASYEIRRAGNKEELEKPAASLGVIKSDQSVNVEFNGGDLGSRDRVYWQVRVTDNQGLQSSWSEPAFFEMGLLEVQAWNAEWISKLAEDSSEGSRPAIYLRKEISVEKKVKSARIYASAMGLYELSINGQKVGGQLFTPGWTSYNKRTQYQVYDVSNMLVKGGNTVGAVLGDGWYRGFIGWSDQNDYYGKRRALIAQIELVYEDGSRKVIGTDMTWKTGDGPILKSDIYNGEVFDAGKEQKGWNVSGFQDADWGFAEVIDSTKSNLIGCQGVPVKAIEELKPINVFETPKGEMVMDIGQNMVGWMRMSVRGKAGDTVVLRFAEVLDKDGNFYTDNLRAAEATDRYVLAGGGMETYEPTFTFHGFRYVQVIGYPGKLKAEDFTAIVIHSDMKPAGKFTCSDDMINQLQHNIKWGQKGNFLDVPTDCPQRDERMGWTGDAQVFALTAAYNYDVAAFYTKWMKDFPADQSASGRMPHVIPDVLKGGGGATGWADATLIIPWTVYQVYGDERILEVQYESMKAWVEYMRGRAGDDHLWTGDRHFGDWLAFATTRSDYPGATTEKDLIATAYYSYSSGLLGKIAKIIGKDSDARAYAELSEEVTKAFQTEFMTKSGRLVSHTQTAYALALAFELVPDALVENTGKYLAEDVEKFGHLTTGFLGTPLLCKTLCAAGREDLAFMLLKRKKYPSWLYPITQGATTIWERWDGQKQDGSFQDIGMNSFNHYAYGAIGEWLYGYVAGLKVDKPGYKHFFLSPHMGGDLTNASMEYESVYGMIKSAWKIENGKTVYEVEVPPNTSATVMCPSGSVESSVTLTSKDGDVSKYEVGSGKYVFNW